MSERFTVYTLIQPPLRVKDWPQVQVQKWSGNRKGEMELVETRTYEVAS